MPLEIKDRVIAEQARRRVHVGDKGQLVRQLENKLKDLGYHPGKLDGVYDDRLGKAGKGYRRDEPQLSAKFSGAGPKVFHHLGGDVRHLEAELKKLGRKPGTVDTKFTKKT